MKNKILSLLKSSKDFVSGEKLSQEFNITRAAIWKYINTLKEDGYEIESVSRKGYRLISSPDLLTYTEVSPYLSTTYIGHNWLHYNSIGSTNSEGKSIAELSTTCDGTVLVSEEQISGRGRLGRSWLSPKHSSISMSIILKPDIDPLYISRITQVVAASTILACKEMNINALIKWPNDIVINSKKVCGILTEMNAELNKIHYVVIGLGFNVNVPATIFPEDLKNTATSLSCEYNSHFNRQELTARILNNFEILYEEFKRDTSSKKIFEICKENSAILDRYINIIRNNTTKSAKALDITDSGELIVQYEDGSIETLISGEVSIRGNNSYI